MNAPQNAADPGSAAPDPAHARYIALTTYRRDGTPVTTPVWPLGLEGRMFVGTTADTGKVKRLRRDARVRFAVCDARGRRILGPWYEGEARTVDDPTLAGRFQRALARKYGWQYRLIMLVYRLRGAYRDRTILEITGRRPVADD